MLKPLDEKKSQDGSMSSKRSEWKKIYGPIKKSLLSGNGSDNNQRLLEDIPNPNNLPVYDLKILVVGEKNSG